MDRTLDAKVAKVMGWKRIKLHEREIDFGALAQGKGPLYNYAGEFEYLVPPDYDGKSQVGVRDQIDDLRIGGEIPHFSSNISAAWEIVEFIFGAYSKEFTLEYGWLQEPGPYWHCHMGLVDATAPTPAEAICLAALKVWEEGDG